MGILASAKRHSNHVQLGNIWQCAGDSRGYRILGGISSYTRTRIIMAYKLVWPKRAEKGKVYKAGDVVDLSHYTPEQRTQLLQQGQYIEVPDVKKAVK